jgi:hypothetical protein
MRNLIEEIKAKPEGVKKMIERMGVSNPSLVAKLYARNHSSKGYGTGCDNTLFDSTWDAWDDTHN